MVGLMNITSHRQTSGGAWLAPWESPYPRMLMIYFAHHRVEKRRWLQAQLVIVICQSISLMSWVDGVCPQAGGGGARVSGEEKERGGGGGGHLSAPQKRSRPCTSAARDLGMPYSCSLEIIAPSCAQSKRYIRARLRPSLGR